MITKDDIERLKALQEMLQGADQVNLNRKSVRLLAKFLAAQLTQPYQWGDEVEVCEDDGEWVDGYSFVGMNPSHKSKLQYVAKRDLNWPKLFKDIRHPKQTVQVTLDKSTQDLAKEILAVIDEHHACCVDQVTTLCKAIASQGGEDNE